MYSNDDGYIYFTDIEEAKALHREDENMLWGTRFMDHDKAWFKLANKPQFNCKPEYYRRLLTHDFRIRKEFREGDPVSWCGVNGGVVNDKSHSLYPIMVRFADGSHQSFTNIGLFKTNHTVPSLSHGHDSTVDDQKYPVERVETNKSMSQADEVEECIPHWQENLRLAIEGKRINRGGNDCPLCSKYHCMRQLHTPTNCPIEQDTGFKNCAGTPWDKTESGKPEHVLEMLNYLIDLERRLRKAGK